MKTGIIHDHHSPHNDACPQNGYDDEGDLSQDCTCQPRTKRHKKSNLINRAYVKKMLLQETNDRQKVRIFTCVKSSTLDDIDALIKLEIINRAESPPRKGKTL